MEIRGPGNRFCWLQNGLCYEWQSDFLLWLGRASRWCNRWLMLPCPDPYHFIQNKERERERTEQDSSHQNKPLSAYIVYKNSVHTNSMRWISFKITISSLAKCKIARQAFVRVKRILDNTKMLSLTVKRLWWMLTHGSQALCVNKHVKTMKSNLAGIEGMI